MRASPAIGRRLAEVEAEFERLESVPDDSTVVPLFTDIRGRIKGMLASLPRLFEADPEHARAALRDAGLGSQIILQPAICACLMDHQVVLDAEKSIVAQVLSEL